MTIQPIRILINGAFGKMGLEATKAIEKEIDLNLVGKCGRHDHLSDTLKKTHAQVALDLTCADAVFENTKIIIEQNVHPVIGTSGLRAQQIEYLQTLCKEKKLGGIIVPNFCLGAVLMMIFAKQAARYFPHCEIIEMHHAQKKDSPSGTAIKTAEFIQAKKSEQHTPHTEIIQGARGALHQHIPIHSIRLPGLVAHQEVLFGGNHELFTLRHDTFHREAFMAGIIMAIKKVMTLNELVYGLENILDL